MENVILFPFSEYWGVYVGFTIFVLLVLALDLGVFHREAHEVSFKEAATWSVVWIMLALIFNAGFYFYAEWKFTTQPEYASIPGFIPEAAARQSALEFLTGYIIEKSLSVDNIFVFVVVFTFFTIPAKYQHRILFYGILGALIFRIIFISLGSVLLQYHYIIIIFGIFLILTGIKILFAPEKEINPDKNPVIKLLKKFLPVTPSIEGQKFFIRQNGVLYATPLLICLVFVELTDIIFAVDSVPAIFAITKEPLIVFTSNIFAILGLRALYFLLAGVVNKFKYLKYGLGLVLIFVGLKMAWLNEAFGGKFPISWSLGIIIGILSLSIIISLIVTKEKT
ncbi:MAG TPA: TerC/Alx family metal homeostasis membrane protein [Melioribacteraceae bacterium]|nr:TerC/Alx family metal homeostasis membrane protein [Melioribacteraceae bacterium]